MSDKFLKNMNHMLENTQSLSLKILLEEKEEKSEEKKEDPFKDPFSDDDNKKDNAEETDSDKESEGSEESESSEEVEASEESKDSQNDEVYNYLSDLSNYTKVVADKKDLDKTILHKYGFHPERNISASFDPITKNSSNLTFKKLMLMKEESNIDKTLDKVEKSLKDEKERIEKIGDDAHDVSSKITTGFDVNIEEKAAQAFNDFERFASKFSKSEIVANWYIDKISQLSPPQDLEKNIKSFLSKYNKLLPKTDKIDIQEEPTKYNTGTGGKTPSA